MAEAVHRNVIENLNNADNHPMQQIAKYCVLASQLAYKKKEQITAEMRNSETWRGVSDDAISIIIFTHQIGSRSMSLWLMQALKNDKKSFTCADDIRPILQLLER